MTNRIRFFLNRLGERLWVKPLVICFLSTGAAFLASLGDRIYTGEEVPQISSESLETLLAIISASMLVIAVFAVGSMLAAYSSASNSATPRSFPIVISDDVSQNALSIFIGAFIFSIVGLTALMNDYYGPTGRFVLFLITIGVFAVVIFGFLRWVDSVARLGRLGTTIGKVEAVTEAALLKNCRMPTLGGARSNGRIEGTAIYGEEVGYVQQIDLQSLQVIAQSNGLTVDITAVPGTFVMPGQPLVYFAYEGDAPESEFDQNHIRQAFRIGRDRTFDEDPRFGLVVLSEIASRALSPAVNDPGTAIGIVGTLVRLLSAWAKAREPEDGKAVRFDRVFIPEVSLDEMFDDAFNAISRDGAGIIEVMVRLQKAFHSLASIDGGMMKEVSEKHARVALRHAEEALKLAEEVEKVQQVHDQGLQYSQSEFLT